MTSASGQTAANRGHVYGLLSTVFRRPLDAAKLARLRTDEMRTALAAARIDPGAEFTATEVGDLLDRLAIDYTRLFHGPEERRSPYESIQTGASDTLMGEPAQCLRRFMAENGFEMADRGELPDHISVELALMATLAEREAAAIAAGETATAAKASALQRRLMGEHLGRWAEAFADQVAARAETRFYAAMAELLANFVAAERADMEQAA